MGIKVLGDRVEGYVGCRHCGQVHRLPAMVGDERACCRRCGREMARGDDAVRARLVCDRVVALSLSAFMLYPAAIVLPIMEIHRFGFDSRASIWTGMVGLYADGHGWIASVILLFSIVAPIGKLGLMLAVCLRRPTIGGRGRSLVYGLVERLGRWGMMDVMLVAILIAVVKLGDVVSVTPGAGVVVFGTVVLLSMLASGMYEPRLIWERDLDS
ncbi:MAG: paraquat-inducible protein A [Phycisphaerales bacterium]